MNFFLVSLILVLYAQIWRTADGQTWEMVFNEPMNGAAALISYKDDLYTASWGPDGKVWRSHNGLDWEEVSNGLESSNLDTARFTAYKDALYLSSWNSVSGTEIWKTADGTQWSRFGNIDIGDPSNAGPIASAEFKGHLYWGACNWDTGSQIWRTDGVTSETVMTGGFGTPLTSLSA